MNRFSNNEKQIKYIELKGILEEITDVADKIKFNAGYDRLLKMQEEIGYLCILIDSADEKIESLIDEKEKEKEEDEIY